MSSNAVERTQHLQALIENGLDFLERSAREAGTEPKFSVVHFATGVELMLKAVLFNEHWTLVSANPKATPWSTIKDGTFISVQASDLVAAVTSIVGTPFRGHDDALKAVFQHRNRVLHFVPAPNVHVVIGEQFRAWFHLFRLLTVDWKAIFDAFKTRIEGLDTALRQNSSYLDVRFNELTKQNAFTRAETEGALINCITCGHASGELHDKDGAMTHMNCRVCRSSFEVANFGCGVWHSFAEGLSWRIECSCGKDHSPQDLADLMEVERNLSPKEQSALGETKSSCGECLSWHTVVEQEEGSLRCFSCGATFGSEDLDDCVHCNESWAGYDCEDTGWRGCEHCDGAAGEIRDDED